MRILGLGIEIVTLCLLQLSWAKNNGPIAQTRYGKVKGTIRFALEAERPVYSYFGVKYGRSPDYMFRFLPAENPWTWDDVRDASNENRPLCVQKRERLQGLRKHTFLNYLVPHSPEMKEDCLTLDIFSPKAPNTTNDSDLLPVILWIHGGSFDAFFSTTKLWALPAFEDVVLVQVQYRLGLFGFLTTEDKWATPNSAFHDHIKAMKWIRDNIREFGGDPNSVTLMGESAGAIAATSHMLIPASKGLFHRVIATSGAPDSMVWKPTFGDSVERMARNVNCHFDDNASTTTCLRNKISTSRLMKLAEDLNIHFKPLDDKNLFPGGIKDLIETKHFASPVPLLMGVMSGEANYILSRRVLSDVYHKGATLTREEAVRVTCQFMESRFPNGDIDGICKTVVNEYMNPSKVGEKGMKVFVGMLEAIGDCWFVSKATRFAQKVKESGQKSYLFEFTRKPPMYQARPKEFVRPYNFSTADHADDFIYMFGIPFIPGLADGKNPKLYFTDKDRQTSRTFMHLLAHFAKTGSPPDDIEWPQYPGYLEIGQDIITHEKSFRKNRMHLWNEVIAFMKRQ